MANKPPKYVLNQACKYFNSATGCWFGDNCKFQHKVENVPCRFFLGGGCKFGDRCRFTHIKPPVPNMYEQMRSNPIHPLINYCNIPPPFPPPSAQPWNYGRNEPQDFQCGQCGYAVKETTGSKTLFAQLTAHYVEKFSCSDPAHMKFFREELNLGNNQTSCSVCMKRFDNVTYLFKHFRTMTRNKKDVAHKTIFEIVARPFVERDLRHETDPAELLDNIRMMIMDPCCLSSDSDNDDYNMEKLTIRMGKMELPALNIQQAFEEEMGERMNNCGFTDGEMEELLCQGVKPWDEDAWDVLDVLNGY